MPRRCCVPACRGNYSKYDKVSTFVFPRDEILKRKWIKAIPRDNFTPSKYSAVCEVHFQPQDVERTSSMYDPRTGKLVTAPLDYPHLKKGAVPSLFPGCPAYLSTASTAREDPEERRQRLENSLLKNALEESLIVQEEHEKLIGLDCFDDLVTKIKNCELHDWIQKQKESRILLILLNNSTAPKVLCHSEIDSELNMIVEATGVKLREVDSYKFPLRVSSTTQLSNALQAVKKMFTKNNNDPGHSEIDDNINLITDSLDHLSSKLPQKREQIVFLKEQVSLLNCNKARLRYSHESLILWSLVHSISPHSYKFLRSSGVLNLPNPTTLARLCSKFRSSPVLEQNSTNILSYLSKKVSFLKEEDKTIVVLVDEIHLKTQMDYKGGNVVGQAHDTSGCASSAQVFMIKSLDSQYVDVAHILPVKTIQAPVLFNFLKTIIVNLESIGFEVVGIITDNNSINKKAVSYFSNPPELKIKYKHPNPSAEERPLYFLFDSVHILKCIRNNWLNQKEQTIVFPDFSSEIAGGHATFSSLKTLHLLEKTNLLKYAKSLCLKSLFPNSLERQNVKLVLHIFNSNTAVALRHLGPKRQIEGWNDTATFIEVISRWWDIVNVKTLLKGKRNLNSFQEPITENSHHIIEFLNKFAQWVMIEGSKSIVGLSKPTHLALNHTTLTLIDLIKYWLCVKKRRYFLTGKFQTDDLESRFGEYRQMSGGNYHVSVRQVFETECKLRIQSYVSLMLKSQKIGNVAIEKNDIFLSDSENISALSLVNDYPDELNVIVDDDDIQDLAEDVWPLLHYISGYCAYRIIKKNRCDYCKVYVTSDEEEIRDTRNCLTDLTNRGGLCYPSHDVVICTAYVYAVTQKILLERQELLLGQNNQRNVLFSICSNNIQFNDLFVGFDCISKHSVEELFNVIISSTINILLNNYTKRINYIQYSQSINAIKRLKKK